MDRSISNQVVSAPVYKLLGRKKTIVVHHDRLKTCNHSTYLLWLQRKRHNFLKTWTIDSLEGQERELEELEEDPVLDLGSLFSLDETLPYMQGNPDQTLPFMLGDDQGFFPIWGMTASLKQIPTRHLLTRMPT